eukprot:1160685-Pelagomonas_calceolata.AAC.4
MLATGIRDQGVDQPLELPAVLLHDIHWESIHASQSTANVTTNTVIYASRVSMVLLCDIHWESIHAPQSTANPPDLHCRHALQQQQQQQQQQHKHRSTPTTGPQESFETHLLYTDGHEPQELWNCFGVSKAHLLHTEGHEPQELWNA